MNIQEWLDTEPAKRNYAEAAALLAPNLPNKQLAKNLLAKHGDGNYWRGKIDELMKLEAARSQAKANKADQVDAKPQMKVVNASQQEGLMTTKEYDAAPDDIKAMEAQRKKLLQQKTAVRAGIEGAESEELRRDMAETVIELTSQIDEAEAQIRYYLKNGTLPGAGGTAKEETLADVLKALPLARSRRTKAQTALDKAKEEDKPAKAKKLAKEQDEVKRLEELKEKLEQTQ